MQLGKLFLPTHEWLVHLAFSRKQYFSATTRSFCKLPANHEIITANCGSKSPATSAR